MNGKKWQKRHSEPECRAQNQFDPASTTWSHDPITVVR